MFSLSVFFTKAKRHKLGLLFALLELLAAVISSGAWAHALKISGKTDWFLFGIFGYTPIGLICFAMFAVGMLCAAINFRGVIKRPDITEPAAQI